MRILTVIGARPQFIKAAPVSRLLQKKNHREILIHTGQHYDKNMSQIFFDELNLPVPDNNLEIGSGTHSYQTAKMMMRIENILFDIQPDWVLVYGDTNSTLGGALAAAKIHVPVAHIEAGLRSFNKNMPEEINRILTDHVSTLLFCPTETAVKNLNKESINNGVHLVGDIMYDALLENLTLARENSTVLPRLGLNPKKYILATIHRAENTNNKDRFSTIIHALGRLKIQVIFPLHPRSKFIFEEIGIQIPDNIKIIEPVGYLDMIKLEENAECILTDSGGIQKEAYLLGVRCITLRKETEWIETVNSDWNKLVDVNEKLLIESFTSWFPKSVRPPYFGDGNAAKKIVEIMETQTDSLPKRE